MLYLIRNSKSEFDFHTISDKKCIGIKLSFVDFQGNEMTNLLLCRTIGNGSLVLVNQVSRTDILQYMTSYNHAYIDKDLFVWTDKDVPV